MFERIKIASKMRKFINSTRNVKNKKLFWKCYYKYITECIIMQKDEFEVKFGSEYYDSFELRIKDWIEYIVDNIDTAFWKLIPDKKRRPSLANYYIEHGVPKPIHLKHHIFVNECALEYFLNQNGFEIASEYLTSLSSTYYIRRVKK